MTADIRERLQAALGDTHTIQRELGGGGMSRVFIAQETRFRRPVVIKLLSPELGFGVNTARFEREIALAATLQQAQIVPVITAGDMDGLPWYSMPFVEGESLRARLAKGPLPIPTAIAILRDVARALAYAHERGVVHRDIKPDNVLLSGESAVVTDFGIAKAVEASRTSDDHERLTVTGSSLGTPAYMPPEQALGDAALDHRADIYAFGCLAYEMFTGRPPFSGASTQQMIAAHFHTTPNAVRDLRSEVPAHISALIAQCLEKDPDRRPENAHALLRVLDAGIHSQRRTSRMAIPAALAIIVLLSAAAFVMRRRDSEPAPTAAVQNSLAVLPFINLGGDSAQEYLADGIRDELATALGKVKGIRITGRSAAFQFHGRRDLDVRQVGHTLGARFLVQGTLRRANGHLQVSAQLSDSTGGTELWADRFDGSSADLASVTRRIVTAISDTLHVGSGGQRTALRFTSNPDAYDLYLRGEYLVQHRGPGVGQSVDNFEHAIALDSSFARAWAGLSAAYVLFPYFYGTAPSAVFARVEAAAKRALALDSALSEPHVSLGLAYWHAGRPAESEMHFRRAIAIDDQDLNAHLQYGRFLLSGGRTGAGRAELVRAQQIDPISPIASAWHAYTVYASGDMAGALAELHRAQQLDSTMLPVVNFAASLTLIEGRGPEAVQIARHAAPGSMSYTPFVLAATGDSAAAFSELRREEQGGVRPWFVGCQYATTYLALGDTSRALTALEHTSEQVPNGCMIFLPVTHPIYDKVRSSARFTALLRSGGIDPATIEPRR